MTKPKIDQLLIQSALDLDIARRLLDTPDEVLADYDLTEEEKDLLRRPDHRLLPLLGAVLARQAGSARSDPEPAPETPPPAARTEARTLPETLIALTVVPCAIEEDGQFQRYSYAVWVNPMPAGGDPASLPSPPAAGLPGRPLAPLHAVIQLSAVEYPDTAGNPQVGLWASFRESTNVIPPPPRETAGRPDASPFGSALDTPPVEAAVAAVRGAGREKRYDRLVDLLDVLRSGDVR